METRARNDVFLSADGETEIGYSVWRGRGYPRAIFQIVHGMAEHIGRYDHFARFLADNGYAVFGHNHMGHGSSVKDPEDLGHIPGKDGYLTLAKDARTLSRIAKERFNDTPLILFGHSMGSFVARLYAELWGDEIDGLILCGTSGANPMAAAGLSVTKLTTALRGDRHRSRFIDFLSFGAYNERISDAKTKFDWLSANEDNVNAYIADELCGRVFTTDAFFNLMTLLKTVSRREWASAVRKELPVLLISGEDDPVGGYKKGVIETANRLRSAGVQDVGLIFYEGMRHEILNETGRDRVYGDILAFSRKIV